jgi:hypothetical protein
VLRSYSRAAKVALPLIASLAFAPSAFGATTGPSGEAFYTPPSPLPAGAHGTLVWYRKATLNLGTVGTPSANTYTVLYKSQSVNGTGDVVTGTVIVPTSLWLSLTPRPVVDFAVGTQGLSHASAPSEQLVAGSEYEAGNIADALKKGWAVEVTDYAGYTNGGVPDYIVGQSEGHAVLDLDLAAQQIPGVGLSASAQTVTWGYSQGGGASAWAAQLAPSYAPSIKLVGDASGGTPSDLVAVADNLNGSAFAAFALYAIIGLNADYPSQINLSTYTNAKGTSAIKSALSDGLPAATLQFAGANIDSYTVNNPATSSPWTLDQLLAIPSIASAVSAQALGGTPITVPVYQYHASSDEIVPLAQDQALNKLYCSEGVKDDWVQYSGDHITVDSNAASNVVTWIGNRFSGATAPSNC